MATGILGIGASALLANQQALATVSHNIANATVEGYSRQSVEFQARTADFRGGNFFGTGVDLSSVRRHVNEYINAQIHADIALQGQLGAQQAYLTRIDNLLATDSTGLSGAFDQFFSALQDMSADPASLPQREVVLQQAANLADRFNNIGQFVTQMEAEINLQIKDQVAQINSLAANLAQLNQTIAITSAAGDGQSAGDLLDQRDRLYN
ncbi:MAG: flagellar hook-associated protein FlgK, partial [Gammaproteobacteria bacterium]